MKNYIAVCQHGFDGSNTISIAGQDIVKRKSPNHVWRTVLGNKSLGKHSIRDMAKSVTLAGEVGRN